MVSRAGLERTSEKEMSEKNVLFDESGVFNLERFSVFFESAAEPMLERNQKARALIKYLRGDVFNFYYNRFAVDGKLSEKRRSYKHVRSILSSQFSTKKDLAQITELVLSLKMSSNQSVAYFMVIAAKAYEAAGFTDKQKFVFLSKAALVHEDIQSFVVQRAPK